MSAVNGTIARTMIALIARVVPQPTSNAITSSPVDIPEDEIEAGEDRDDVGDVHAAQHPRQDRHVAERRRPDLHSERAGRALRDDVVAHLTERVLGVDPDLALRHLDDARHLRHYRA